MYLAIMHFRRTLEQVQINYRCEEAPIVAALQHREAETADLVDSRIIWLRTTFQGKPLEHLAL